MASVAIPNRYERVRAFGAWPYHGKQVVVLDSGFEALYYARTARKTMPKEVLMRYAASAVLVLAMVALVTKLVLAPFHHVYTADECRAAYAEARTSMDSIAVDFKPFDDGDNAVDTRCKAVRPIRALSSSDILP